jgi:hypothetical protein
MRAKIIDWFERDCPFHEGFLLLTDAGGNTMPYLRVVSSPNVSAYWREKMAAELNAIAAQMPESVAPENPTADDETEKEPSKRFSKPIEGGFFEKKAEPQAVLDLRAEAKKLHKRHAFLHAGLAGAADDAARFKLAEEILESIVPRLDEIYDAIRKYSETGDAPQPADRRAIVKETVEKMKRLDSLEPRISRLKKMIENGGLAPRDLKKYDAELAAKLAEAVVLREELGL